VQKEKQYTKQYKTQNTRDRKQTYKTKNKHKKNVTKHKSSNYKITNTGVLISP